MTERIVIVGAGHAGGACAAALRKHGSTATITLIGQEEHLPYQRPPLSKAWLAGEPEAGKAKLELRPAAWYEKNNIDLKTSSPCISLDLDRQQLHLAAGDALAYDNLVLATGASPRRLSLPGAELPGVVVLRDRSDALALREHLGPGRRLVVIGGGYLGLEAAATARGLGATVDVIERADRLLARVASQPVADAVLHRHRRHGVGVHVDAETVRIVGAHDAVSGVELGDGRTLPCDVVLVAVGAVPNIDLARNAGIACTEGVLVDEQCATSDPYVFGIGDMTVRPVPGGAARRVESVGNAVEQAEQVAALLCGKPAPAPVIPWFWSDQYGESVQIAGLAAPTDDQILRGQPEDDRFAVFHLRDGRLTGVEAVNSPRDAMWGKRAIASGEEIDIASLETAHTSAPSGAPAPRR